MDDNFVANAQRNAADFIAGRSCNVLPKASWRQAIRKIEVQPFLSHEQRGEVTALAVALQSGSDIERMMLLSQVSKIDLLSDDDRANLVGIAAAIELIKHDPTYLAFPGRRAANFLVIFSICLSIGALAVATFI